MAKDPITTGHGGHIIPWFRVAPTPQVVAQIIDEMTHENGGVCDCGVSGWENDGHMFFLEELITKKTASSCKKIMATN